MGVQPCLQGFLGASVTELTSCIGRQAPRTDVFWVCSRCFVSPTISYLLLQSKTVLTAYRASVSSSPILCSAILLNAMHIGDYYRDFPLRPACCRYPLVSRPRHLIFQRLLFFQRLLPSRLSLMWRTASLMPHRN
jgi:hypothetical protein